MRFLSGVVPLTTIYKICQVEDKITKDSEDYQRNRCSSDGKFHRAQVRSKLDGHLPVGFDEGDKCEIEHQPVILYAGETQPGTKE